MVVVNEVRRGFYLDSVALMRISRAIAALPDVEEAGLMIGTPANKEIMRDARVLGEDGTAAGPGDLVIAVRARSRAAAAAALVAARRELDAPRRAAGPETAWQPRTLRAAIQLMPDANLALISVPGDFAAAEARKALRRGLNVLIFSDNVPIAEEAELKREARARGLLVMGPDCGTAIIGGARLGFANVVPRGDIGIIGASGTGIQEISCLIARAGGGVSHAIGTGGRDLHADVGAITMLMAIDAFDADAPTSQVVLVSKPPAPALAKAVLERIGRSPKPHTVCFLGNAAPELPRNARRAATLKEAAELAAGRVPPMRILEGMPSPRPRPGGRHVRGLYSGGGLCAEAQVVLRQAGLAVASNVPVPGAARLAGPPIGHVLIDLGDDEYTRGRPHPMIEPAVRDAPLAAALADADVAVVLVDVVLGHGSHADPAGHLAEQIRGRRGARPAIIAAVTGTDRDPQSLPAQVSALRAAGVVVAGSNADAAALAASVIGR